MSQQWGVAGSADRGDIDTMPWPCYSAGLNNIKYLIAYLAPHKAYLLISIQVQALPDLDEVLFKNWF